MGRFIIPYILGGEKLVVFIEFKKRSFGLRPHSTRIFRMVSFCSQWRISFFSFKKNHKRRSFG